MLVPLFWLFHGPARVVERKVALKIQQAFRLNLYEQFTHLPLKWHQDHHSGNIITRVNRASTALHRFAEDQFIYIETIVKFVISIGFLMCAIATCWDNKLNQPFRYGFYSYPTYPDGALKTSVNEFARFLFLFVNKGKAMDGKPFLRTETVKEMLHLHKFPEMGQGEAIGLAWHFDGDVYCHNGVDPGISTLTYFNQATDQATIFFSNGDNFDVLVPFLEENIKNFIELN